MFSSITSSQFFGNYRLLDVCILINRILFLLLFYFRFKLSSIFTFYLLYMFYLFFFIHFLKLHSYFHFPLFTYLYFHFLFYIYWPCFFLCFHSSYNFSTMLLITTTSILSFVFFLLFLFSLSLSVYIFVFSVFFPHFLSNDRSIWHQNSNHPFSLNGFTPITSSSFIQLVA